MFSPAGSGRRPLITFAEHCKYMFLIVLASAGSCRLGCPNPPPPTPGPFGGAHRAPPGLPQGPFGPLGTDGASRRADGGGRTALRAAHKVFFVLSWETFSMSEVRMRNAELPNLAQIRSEYLNMAWRGREYPSMVRDCSEWSRLTQVGPELPNLD